jgi:GNAT superfamily N-acetyltransferase
LLRKSGSHDFLRAWEFAVTVFHRRERIPQHQDILRLRDGRSLVLRFIEPEDAEAIQSYFRSLSARSRYNRFFGAISELPPRELDHFIHSGEDDRFSIIAVTMTDGVETIVGEARYGVEMGTANLEFGLSVDDRWHRCGIGSVLLENLECRAAALGARGLFGDTLRSNDEMIGLARKSGFVSAPTPGDWKLVRFEKDIETARQDFPARSRGVRRR